VSSLPWLATGPVVMKGVGLADVAVVANCSAECKIRGCQYDNAIRLLGLARGMQVSISAKVKDARMGFALWCDKGNHAFSENDDCFTGSRTVSKNGSKETVSYVMCQPCMNGAEVPSTLAIQNDSGFTMTPAGPIG
jgi:hypothetical protein